MSMIGLVSFKSLNVLRDAVNLYFSSCVLCDSTPQPDDLLDFILFYSLNAFGRPTEYSTTCNEQVKKLCLLGAIDTQIADFFNVCAATIDTWKKEHPDFLGAIEEGKKVADNQVVKSLYKRANGYVAIDTKFATFEGEISDEREYDKHYPPDTNACMFWLKNRDRDNWREKQDINHSGDLTITVEDTD